MLITTEELYFLVVWASCLTLLNSRIYDFLSVNKLLGEEQAGFRKHYSTMDHIFALHVFSNFYIAHKRKLFCAFIDFKKAFDLVNRSYLWTKLINKNVNGKIFDVVRSLYSHTKSCVRIGSMDLDYFPCNVGVRQGENLSPLLFSIYLNDLKDFMSSKFSGLSYISDKISQEIGMYFNLYCLLYADDTIVLAENEVQLQRALDAVYEYCNKWAVQVNTNKTKVVIFSKGKV